MFSFGSPTSWVLVEFFSLIAFFVVLSHAIKQDKPFIKVLEIFGFILGATLFENVGTGVSHSYYYDARRIMMIGGVPLEILLLEAVIWYAAFNLSIKLKLPIWALPFSVGLFGSVQDMTIDPAAVFDSYPLPENLVSDLNTTYPNAFVDGNLSGQWNWTNPGWGNGFFGIPFYNFSGWMYLMFYYTMWALIGRWLYEKFDHKIIAYLYPFFAGVLNVVCIGLPLNIVMLFGTTDPANTTQNLQLIMLCINYGMAILLLIVFYKRMGKLDISGDIYIIFGIPIALHVYDIVYAFAKGTTVAYTPVILISIIHFAYLYFVFKRIKA